MKVTPTALPGVLLLEPRVFSDDRGFFFESFNARAFADATGVDAGFVQDNHSHSRRNVLRGLHYQVEQAQGKLVRAASGEVFDRWEGVVLSAANRRMLWVPPGFAHGFLVLSESADFLYKTTDYYAPQHERCLLWNDPAVGVQWPLPEGEQPVLSAKDGLGAALSDAQVYP